jgi:DDE_Tnp_1-associated
MTRGQSPAERALDQVNEWLEHFGEIDDPRQSGKVWYPLEEMLLLCLLAVLAGAESWVEIAEFGKKKVEFLQRFRPFQNGTPSHDQLGDLFAALDAEAFQRGFIAWVGSLTKLGPDIVAIDGKTLRRAYQEGGAKAPIHMISAWSSRQRLVLGQAKVADIERNHRHPRSVGSPDTEGCDRDHRCHGLPKGDRGEDQRKGGGLCARAERQPGHAAAGRRALLHGTKSSQLRRHNH